MVRLPNFLVIGVPKSGTSSLYEYLKTHPQIYLSEKKELHYFSKSYILNDISGPGDSATAHRICKSYDEYCNYFDGVPHSIKAIGDFSPSYFYFPTSFEAIKETLGNDIKIILILRDPIKRAFSNYLHLVRSGREKLTFWEALHEEENRITKGYGDFWRYKDHSKYARKLDILYQTFEPQNVLLLTSESMQKNLKATLIQIFDFLEVDTHFVPPNINTNYNQGGTYKNPGMVKAIRKTLRSLLIFKNIVPSFIKNKIKFAQASVIEKNLTKDLKITHKEEAYLKAYFEQEYITLKNRFGITF